MNNKIKILKKKYFEIKKPIKEKIESFVKKWEKGSQKDVFLEFIFCILTPQSNAKFCWEAVLKLSAKNYLLNGTKTEISNELNKVRFKNKKAEYIILAREKFIKDNKFIIKNILKKEENIREWLVKNIKGFGYKEASHFLRNIGINIDLSILDRHILKNLKFFNIIDNIPITISKKKYISIEEKMKAFSENIQIPLSHLDLLFWYNEKGELFK